MTAIRTATSGARTPPIRLYRDAGWSRAALWGYSGHSSRAAIIACRTNRTSTNTATGPNTTMSGPARPAKAAGAAGTPVG